MPHGYPYQEIPFWFESQFKGLDPSRAELCVVMLKLFYSISREIIMTFAEPKSEFDVVTFMKYTILNNIFIIKHVEKSCQTKLRGILLKL